MGYHGGPGFLTGPGTYFDVSNAAILPGLIDPTNTSPNGYYRSVAEVDASGHVTVTDGNAYSGDNGRGAFKGGSLYYLVGNDNSGNLSKKQVTTTIPGEELVHATGAELLYPGQAPPVATFPDFSINKIGTFSISQVTDPLTGMPYAADKAGKDNNYRGITIFDNTLYVTKGSGGNGINTVYQVGATGVLPSGDVKTLASAPITILPGFPVTLAAGVDPTTNATTPVMYPFGIWFADANTLYVADEGDNCTEQRRCALHGHPRHRHARSNRRQHLHACRQSNYRRTSEVDLRFHREKMEFGVHHPDGSESGSSSNRSRLSDGH